MSVSIRSAIRGPLTMTDNGPERSRRSRRTRRSLGLLSSLAAGALIGATAISPANAALGAVGPADAGTGFPTYYQDVNGIKLGLCLVSANCLAGTTVPDPTQPASVATGNFPDEAFYAYASADVTLTGGGRVRWLAVVEAAFLTGDIVDGDQMTFTRIQLNGSKINTRVYPVDTVLTARTPYGTISGTVKKDGTLVRNRKESAPGTVDNGFRRPVTEATTGYGGTFLRWNAGAPAGFIGNPDVLHAVTGAKAGYENSVQVFRGTAAVSPEVAQFSVGGQIAE
ncbi:MAG: hypothetical protein JWN06_1736 [Propionibacteriaceae bacterium]|jgi:hypothetical protein|nr:hypothetical protein [Propionibacteriaceae bacterium]